MTSIDSVIASLNSVDATYLYFTVFFFAFIENLFPPSPSDLVIAFAGSLVGFGKLSFITTILISTAGSATGFSVMYWIGYMFGRKILDSGRLRFIPLDQMKRVEKWFGTYGYGIVAANRFLSGTRAVVSFFAGLSKLSAGPTLLLCIVSASVWNSILIYSGSILGANWKVVKNYLEYYSSTVLLLIIAIALFFIIRYFYRKRHGK
ncbi:MAG: DedA family protein [Candidatus Kryptoniota bacterium]